jgi:N-methylhydantoinase B
MDIAAAALPRDAYAVATPRRADPVVTEIVRNCLIAATEEMKTNLMRTAYNMIIYEALDFTVGLFDAQGNILSIGLGLPMFIRGISDTIKAKLRHFGPDGIVPGDILLTNDAYITGSHLNHMTFSVPIFHEGRLVAFSGCMAHWPDVGGTLDGITTDIYSEGLQLPIVKACRAGVANEELLAIIRMNVRLPERAMGDLRAQIAAVKTGEKRFLEMIRKYGCDAVLAAIADIMDHSEARARARLGAFPDGVYEAQSFMDDDGVVAGQRIPIRVRVEIAGDRMTVDLSDIAKQVSGFYNSGETAGRSCCGVAFKCLTSPLDLPINEGQFRPLAVILPPGRVVSAVKPAAMRMWMTYPMTIVDTIFKALSPAIPQHIIAGHHADLIVGRVNGRRPQDNSFYIYLGGLIGGGWGAKHDSDGVSATIAMNDGDTHNGPSEQVEAKYPLLVERYALRPDSGGAGKYRGGLGTEQIVQARHDIRFNAQIDRVKCRPWGLFGGLPASGNGVAIHRFGAAEQTFPSGKAFNQILHSGDAYILRSGGGGGFGSPLERDLDALENDVRQGYVSQEAAERDYGAVFASDAARIDRAASERRRAEMRQAGLPRPAPQEPPEEPPEAAASDHHGHAHGPVAAAEQLSEEERLVFALSARCCS